MFQLRESLKTQIFEADNKINPEFTIVNEEFSLAVEGKKRSL
jgi:hypothetical protein